MKIVASVYKWEQLNQWIDAMDCAILNVKECSLIYEDLDLDQAISFCLEHKVVPILAMNRILHPRDISFMSQYIMKYKAVAYFLTTDLAMIQIAKKEACLDRIIYDPQTMIANKLDLKTYGEIGCHALSMSLEIPYHDVLESMREYKGNLFYQVFGYRLMFYSKRKLIKLYEEKQNIIIHRNHLFLKEQTRDALYPIIENENGTMIYRSYLISLLKEIYTNPCIEYGYLESLYLPNDIFYAVLKLYQLSKNKEISIEEAIQNIKELDLHIEDGWTYQDSIYQKELF